MSVAQQHTLNAPVVWAGIGLHTGAMCEVTVSPAPINSGILIQRVDDPVWGEAVRVSPDLVTDTHLCTALTRRGVSVLTVEHLFAALSGSGVDNAVIALSGPEIPALDGSAGGFVRGLDRVGLCAQSAPRQALRVTEPIEIRDGERWARIEPCNQLELDVSIDFAAAAVGRQRWHGVMSPEMFDLEIATARTFAFKHDVDALRAKGLAQGGSLDNCVVVDGDDVVNDGGLRFTDEFVRHKVLDVLGDLFTLGMPLLGRYVVHRPGHGVNNAMARAIAEHAVVDVVRLSDVVLGAAGARSVILAAE